MKKQNRPRFRRKYLIPLTILGLILLVAAVGGVSAKYVKDMGSNNALVRAKEFYFSSNLLKENGMDYTLNPGTKSIALELRNHDDQLRCSEENVTYEITADNGATVTVASENRLLEGGKISSKEIIISGLMDGVTYTVTATGRAGYEKILWATFTVKQQGNGVYKYLTMDPSGAFVLLTVWTENAAGDVTISIPAGLIPDATDAALAGIQNYNTEQGKYLAASNQSAGALDAYSSYTYRFFLEAPFTKYIADDFSVTVGGKTAKTKTPE